MDNTASKTNRRIILIVNNSEEYRNNLNAILGTKYDVIETDGGKKAVDIMLENLDVDMAIPFIDMPDMSGYELTEIIKSNDKLRDVSVVFNIGDNPEEDGALAIDRGADDFIRFPFDREKTVAKIDGAMDKRLLRLKENEENARKTAEKTKELLDAVPNGFIVYAIEDGEIVARYANNNMYDILGYNNGELDKLSLDDSLSYLETGARTEVRRRIRDAYDKKEEVELEFRIKTKADELKWLRLKAAPFTHEDGELVYHAVIADITKEKETEARLKDAIEKLRYSSRHDRLTGLYNLETFAKETSKMIHSAEETDFSVLYWDIDDFNAILELYGNKIGESVLMRMAEAIEESTYGNGTFGRLESDHFVSCIPSSQVEPERLVAYVAERMSEIDIDYNIEINLGIYDIEDRETPVDYMCMRAHAAQRIAKKERLKRYAYYDSALRKTKIVETEIAKDMNAALEEDQFEIMVQPIYSLSSGMTVGAETYVRWNHPQKGIIQPEVFIPVFERSGFISTLYYNMWERVCGYMRDRIDSGLEVLPLAMRVSKKGHRDPEIVEKILDVVNRYELNPKMIKIELLYREYEKSREDFNNLARKFRESGFEVVMLIGEGEYSLLNLINNLDVDVIKFDLRFWDETENVFGGGLLASLIKAAHMINISVIAGGVENKRQAELLRSLDCDRAQGYYFSGYMKLDEYTDIILQENAADFDINAGKPDAQVRKRILEADGFGEVSEYLRDAYAVFVLDKDDNLRLVRANSDFYKLYGIDKNRTFYDYAYRFYVKKNNKFVNAELAGICRDAVEKRGEALAIVNVKNASGGAKALLNRIRRVGGDEQGETLYCSVIDVTGVSLEETGNGFAEPEFETDYSGYVDSLEGICSNIFELNLSRGSYRIINSGEDEWMRNNMKGKIEDLSGRYKSVIVNFEEVLASVGAAKENKSSGDSLSESVIIQTETDGNAGYKMLRMKNITRGGEDILICFVIDIDDMYRVFESKALDIRLSERLVIDEIIEKAGAVSFTINRKKSEISIDDRCLEHVEELFGFNIFERLCELIEERKTDSELIHSDDEETFFKMANRWREGDTVSPMLIRLKSGDGGYLWCKLVAESFCDEYEDKDELFIAAFIYGGEYADDVMKLTNNKHIAEMLDCIPTGFAVFSADDGISQRFVNKALKARLGLSSNKRAALINDSDFNPKFLKSMYSLTDGQTLRTEFVKALPDKNGNMIDVLFMITVKSIEGRIVIYAVADDLTEAGMLDIKKALYTEINSMLLEDLQAVVFSYDASADILEASYKKENGRRDSFVIDEYVGLISEGKPVETLAPESCASEVRLVGEKIAELVKNENLENIYDMESNILSRGDVLYRTTMRRIFDSKGGLSYIVGNIEKIKEED
ncbi:MAG TPA: EAL domain-containing protein [Firmicutes bacterium]|nr:EAL domain-containing protein [Bacillota bacterium]